MLAVVDRPKVLAKLIKAEGLLKRTQAGYVEAPDGPFWRTGLPLLWECRLALKNTENGKRLAEAHGLLKHTEKGYDPRAPRWREAMLLIDVVEADLHAPPLPDLGPVVEGGKPVLLEAPTHNTDGLFESNRVPKKNGGKGSHYAACDFGWRAGLEILAWETFEVTGQSSAMGADAFYGIGQSGLPFWLGHITRSPATRSVIEKGESFTKIAAIEGADHGHLGFDGRPLMPGDFTWGNPVGRDYTFGGPTYGQQLAKALAA